MTQDGPNIWNILGGIVLVVLSVVLTTVLVNPPNRRAPDAPDEPLVKPAPVVKRQFVFVSAPWCQWCGKMERTTLVDPRVRAKLDEYVVIKASGKDAQARYQVARLPTYLILDETGKTLRRGEGYRSADELLAWIDGRHGDAGQIRGQQSRVEDEP